MSVAGKQMAAWLLLDYRLFLSFHERPYGENVAGPHRGSCCYGVPSVTVSGAVALLSMSVLFLGDFLLYIGLARGRVSGKLY